ncbi:unnamed protein product [Coccothraustes coccothraustes]
MGDREEEENWVFSVCRHLLSSGGFSVPDASLIDLLVWARVHEIPMGVADAFDLGRCQELCGPLAEEFYGGDDAIPLLLADFLCTALRDQARGAETGSSSGGGGAGASDAQSSGSSSPSVHGSAPSSPAAWPRPPSEGGAGSWLRQKIRLSPPLLPKNRGSPIRLMSRLSLPLMPKSRDLLGHRQPCLSPPRRLLGVGVLLSRWGRSFQPNSPPPSGLRGWSPLPPRQLPRCRGLLRRLLRRPPWSLRSCTGRAHRSC